MRVIGAPDIFLANDAAVRNGIRALSGGASPVTSANPITGTSPITRTHGRGAEPSSDFREVSPWRSYATMHLWRAAAAAPKQPPRGALTNESDSPMKVTVQ
jgi:AraC family transcriptional regulator of adaptative response / DNA-3-methyladenine glycosylase II